MFEIFKAGTGLHILAHQVEFSIGIGQHVVLVGSRANTVVLLRNEHVALDATVERQLVAFVGLG